MNKFAFKRIDPSCGGVIVFWLIKIMFEFCDEKIKKGVEKQVF